MWLLGILLLVAASEASPPKSRMTMDGRMTMAGRIPPAAQRLLDRMNQSVDPCEDFYQYACGGLIENAEIKPDQFMAGTFQDMLDRTNRQLQKLLGAPIRRKDIKPVKQAKLFYRSCLNTAEVEANATSQVLSYLDANGGTWPTFDSSWDESSFDLELSMAAATRQDTETATGPGPLIRTTVIRDFNSDDYRITSVSPTFDIGTEDFIVDILVLLGADQATAEADAAGMVALNDIISNLASFSGIERLNVTQLTQETGTFDWLEYLNDVFRETDHVVTESELLQVLSLDYFIDLMQVLDIASKRDIQNLIKWRMFLTLRRALPEAVQQRFFENEMLETGQEVRESREVFCAKVVNGQTDVMNSIFGMDQAVARMYVEKYSSKQEKIENQRIAELQLEAFVKILEKNDWLSGATRANFIAKVRNIRLGRVYPNTTFDDEYLENFYRDFNISKGCYATNYINSMLGNVRRSLEQIIIPERYKWPIAATILNGVIDYFQSQTVVTAAFLTDPVYDTSYPLALKFGGGFLSAQEIAHAVGTFGILFDENGFLAPVTILSLPSALELYSARLLCLVIQYNGYEIPFTDGLTINGVNTLEENLADNVGLKIAYYAYDKLIEEKGEELIKVLPFSARQLFFISIAQQYCEVLRPEFATLLANSGIYSPGEWRVKGPMRNLPEFAETFSCPAGSFMYPNQRCIIY